jgi:hypothetical protein
MRRIGKLTSGESAAIEQRAENICTRRIADEGRDGGHIKDIAHALDIARQAPVRTR